MYVCEDNNSCNNHDFYVFVFVVHPPEVTVRAESYLYATVFVVMEWTQEKGAFYNFSIEPQATVTNTNNTFVQMEVRYNTMYNVNIVWPIAIVLTVAVLQLPSH